MNQSAKRILSFVLCLAMVLGMFPAFAFGASAAGTDPQYLMFATDRHTNTSIIGEIINNMESVIGENKLNYLALGGDMVGSGNSHPAYSSSEVLGEVTSATSSLSAANVDIVAGIHDMNVTDDAGIVLPYQGGGAQIYAGEGYYVYGVEEYCISEDSNETNWSSEAQKFVTWANGTDIDKSAVIFVSSHYPLHANRDDNDGAYIWHQALNSVATGGDSTVERNIVFFHGHNHTVDGNEYVYNVGDTMSIQNGSSTTSDTIYYTYATAGYLNQNSKATLVTLTDEQIVLEKYTTSGTGTAMTTVTRVETATEETTDPSTDPSEESSEPTTEETTEGTSGQDATLVGEESDATVPGTAEQTTTTKVAEEVTVYKLVSAPENGKTYLIVNSANGTGYGLDSDTTGYATSAFTGGSDYYSTWDDTSKTGTAFSAGSDVYLSTSGAYLWTAGDNTFSIGYDSDSSNSLGSTSYTYTLNPAGGTSGTWELSGNQLSISLVTTDSWFGSDTSTTYYLSGGSTWSMSTTAANVYFYEPVTVYQVTEQQVTTPATPDTTYHMDLTVDGNTVSNHAYTVTGVENGTTVQMNAAYTATADGTTNTTTAPANGSYTVLSSSNEDVATLGTDGVLTFTGTEGETLIQVEYTWTVNGVEYKTQNYVVITAKAPVYDLVASCDDTQIKIGATTTVTASVTKDDAPYSATDITFTSSDETIATVDASTGVVTGVKAGDVTITATWTDDNGVVHTDAVSIEVVDAVYALDICKKTTDADGNETYESITAPIVIKGVTNGMTHSVWAVITKDGEDLGTLTEEQLANLTFTSSNEAIATVDKTTGTVTFTGEEGTVNITASYEYADGKFVTDTVTFSVTASNYSIPSDGTSDFPEYPNEGAIRYDKTATAVGNFSQTGIAQVELSMTGVPYTTGSEIDVVVMLDMTGSMSDNGMTAAEEATVAFVEKIVKNEDGTYNNNRVAVYAFNSGSSSPYELVSLKTITSDDELSTANTAIRTASDKQASGGTPFDEATKQCYDVLKAAKTDGIGNDRQQFCVFMSDGGPTTYYGSDEKTYYGGNNNSGDVKLTDCMVGYTSSTSSDWSFTLPTEYYTDAMKADGVIVYTVGLLLQTAPSNPAPYSSMTDSTYDSTTDSLTTIGSHYYFTSSILKQMASDESKYIDIFNVDNASKATAAFESIAKSIMQAATDVTVEDKINDEYTMVFGIPTNVYDDHNDEVADALSGQEFYIEFVEYTLDENNERTSTYTTLTKLYLKDSNGTGTAGGTYSAASDASGTAYATPVFENKTLGDKGTLYYWTTDSSKSTSGISCTVSGTTYYFVPYGIKATDDGYDATKWFNMTSGGYASGNIDETTNLSTDLVIATPYFVYNAETRMLYWTVEKLDTSEYALRYFLYLDNSSTDVGETTETAAGPYPTNDYAYITYTNFNKNDCRQEFPIPQMTWNGATVSYVFYLVNEAGQPINKSGQVVDFANATFITDVFQHTVVWNGDNAVEELNIEYLADELLPDAYIVYDEKAEYTIHVYQDESGNSVFDYFIIEGSAEGTVNAVNGNTVNSDDTTKVYNTKAGTKYSEYGTYSAEAVGTNFETTDAAGNAVIITTTHQASLDYSDTTVAFAVLWKPRLVEDTVVVDYGLDVLINVVENDILQNTVTGIGLGNDTFVSNSITMNTGVYNIGEDNGKLGSVPLPTADGSTISLENENAIRFSQNDMTFAEPVTFYYESPVEFYEGSNKKTGYLYSSVTVIPATTIYYEDEYVTLKTYEATKDENGEYVLDDYDNPVFDTVGTDGWDTNSVAASATQQQDRPGASQIAAALDADNNYGYDAAYAEMSSHSMDNAAKINVNAYKKGEATFTFYGTGFDVISVTSNMTGTLMVQVTGTTASGASYRKNLMVDTYYGYTQNADGEWVTEVNNPNALYQVPVIKLGGLEYGQYTVKLVAAYSEAFAHDTTGSYDLYLDAIRIYDPTGNKNDVANNAYKADGEGWPIYKELRNLVIEANTFGSYLTVDSEGSAEVQVDGAVFIDSDDSTSVISDYISYGPNNELYLAAGQAVAFEIADAFVNSSGTDIDPVKVQLAIKTVGTSDAKVEIFNPSISTSTTTEGTTQTTTKTFVKGDLIAETISTATDMYYDITALTDDVIVISNPGTAGIISITNLKFTFEEAASVKTVTTTNEDGTEETSEASVASISEEGAVYSLRSLSAYSVSETTEVETEATEPETTEPETEATEPETTEPETEATEPETTEPETEETVPETTEPETDDSGSDSTITDIIKKLFGWLLG